MAVNWQRLGRIAMKNILDKMGWREIASDLWEKSGGKCAAN